MNFFKQVLATIVGLTIFQIISFIMFFVFIGIIAASFKGSSESSASTETIEENSLLTLKLNYDIKERDGFPQFDFNDLDGLSKEKAGLQSLLEALKFAETDERIKGIYMDLSLMPNGYATIDVLREALNSFKSTGKFVMAYGEMIDQKSYYLASVADKLYVNPEGYIELRGVGAQLTFFKKLLEEKLEAEVQVFKVGDYKSAVEPFIQAEMSEANREQLTYLLGGIKEDFVNNIADARNISPEDFDEILNSLAALDPKTAAELNILDGTRYFDEVLGELKTNLGIDQEDDIESISLNDYAMATAQVTKSSHKIAVIYAEGSIVDGKGDEMSIGGEKFAKQIRELRNDEDIEAIVLRVNSPGGSALASEVMWRELELAKAQKPVVVSMGEVAASGGYYIACNSDKIYAEENTITGSIGVFGLIPNLEKFMNNKLGVTFDEVNLNEHASSNGVTNSFTEFEAAVIQKNVDNIYKTFTTRVAEGRGMAIEDVLAVASGRVWTGEQAMERGLVDEIGGLDDAIAHAAELAELEDFRIKEYPEVKSPFEQFISEMGMEVKQSRLKENLGPLFPYFEELQSLYTMNGKVQAKMPMIIEIY